MNALVFATYDVTPQDWANFVKSAAMPEFDISPYILVSSRTHKDFDEETKEIQETVESEFKTATYGEIKDVFAILQEANSATVVPHYFLHLDEQSPRDRKVVITEKAVLKLTAVGKIIPPRTALDDSGERVAELSVLWKRHRVPFEETGTMVALLEAHGGVDPEPHLEEAKEERIRVADY